MAGKDVEAGLLEPGQFSLERAELLTSEGVFVDISSSIVELTIIEGIDKKAISGYSALIDNVALASFGPIIGQEYLILKISTPTLDESEFKIDFTTKCRFMIFNLGFEI